MIKKSDLTAYFIMTVFRDGTLLGKCSLLPVCNPFSLVLKTGTPNLGLKMSM